MHPFPRLIATSGSHEIVIKKSRFICTLVRTTTEDEARAVIDDCKKRFWDANHNCSAYRVGENGRFQRSNDDGEPAGTAGSPTLAVLNRRDLTDVVAVVTRYFGGTLLGAGGLIPWQLTKREAPNRSRSLSKALVCWAQACPTGRKDVPALMQA